MDSIGNQRPCLESPCLLGFARLIGLAILIGPCFSGCSSDRMVRPERESTNVVRRPTYDVPEGKTVYLGGYAGASYDPADIPGR